MFNKVYEIKYSDTDEFMRLKPSVFFEYLEDIAAKNADEMDFGYEKIYSQNLGWFLLKYAIEIDSYPSQISSVRLETESRGANKHFAYRDFYFYDENNKLLGRATSTWALIDLANKSMLNPKETLGDKIWDFVKKENDVQYSKILPVTEVSSEKVFEIRYDDIDVNKHVNNARYMLWAIETLPVDFLKDKTLKRIDIQYKKDISYGNNVISQVQILGEKTIHTIKNAATGEDLCSMLLEWN